MSHNGTPGGCLLDVTVQLAECEVPREVTPKFIVIAAGTNDMARHFLPGRLDTACGSLIETAKKRFPESKVSNFCFKAFMSLYNTNGRHFN